MTTIVMNTLTGAVSEYDWDFQSITPTHAGSAVALYALGGDTDAGQPIDATITTPKRVWGETTKSLMSGVYFAMQSAGNGVLQVHTPSDTYSYPVQSLPDGVSRGVPGRGIRENYLGFSYKNVAGAFFRIDRMEIPSIKTKSRRL
ncbi:hypothetical protein IB236_13170 [Acidovorax sp. ACV02]|uniref:hypothetical protein n=1 Tax=Acidovorax sp. ACV02 TaxID=2769310 RepID=UPI00177FD093|nr:hypothetical protein [Acidovorax sp. ACV02]MBD9406293.1 hypothetical protein [Acidovorax sp. ACV02]